MSGTSIIAKISMSLRTSLIKCVYTEKSLLIMQYEGITFHIFGSKYSVLVQFFHMHIVIFRNMKPI